MGRRVRGWMADAWVHACMCQYVQVQMWEWVHQVAVPQGRALISVQLLLPRQHPAGPAGHDVRLPLLHPAAPSPRPMPARPPARRLCGQGPQCGRGAV